MNLNKNRRKFLKLIAIGGVAAVLAKVFDSRVLNLFSAPSAEAKKDPETEKEFGSFRLSKDQSELIISDKDGEEMLIIDRVK